MQHIDCLAVAPVSKKASVGLSTGRAEILGTLVSPVAEHTIGLRAEYGHPASFSNSESRLLPPADEPGIFFTASAPLAPYIVGILETRAV